MEFNRESFEKGKDWFFESKICLYRSFIIQENPYDIHGAVEAQYTEDISNLRHSDNRQSGDIYDLNARTIARFDLLQSQIADLESKVAALEAVPPGLGAPDFDSGWIEIDNYYMHIGYSTEDIPDYLNTFLYMELRSDYGNEPIVHHHKYGGYGEGWEYLGAEWKLYPSHIMFNVDHDSSLMDYVRFRIWQLPS